MNVETSSAAKADVFRSIGDNHDSALDFAAEEKELTRFEQAEEFQKILLALDFYPGGLGQFRQHDRNAKSKSVIPNETQGSNEVEASAKDSNAEAHLRRLMAILDEYQDQSYLLDPYLEQIVQPPVRVLQKYVHATYNSGEPPQTPNLSDVARLSRLLYYCTKVRGYKTILHFFPHAVDDLLPTLTLLEQCMDGNNDSAKLDWEVRYVLLLWLMLICMIPFDLARFDDVAQGRTTVERIICIGKYFLASPGKERDAAANMLAKVFQRRDAGTIYLSQFLQWSKAALLPSAQPSTFVAMGILQTLCAVVKILSPDALSMHMQQLENVVSLYSSDEEEANEAAGCSKNILTRSLTTNSVVNKYKAKIFCRLGLKLLGPQKRIRVLKASVLSDPSSQASLGLGQDESVSGIYATSEEDEDENVPEKVDEYIAQLMDALQDKDTIVRYSAAKGIARLCCRLPPHFIDQIADEITSFFAVNVSDLMGKHEDLTNVSEFTWQGCCLALAEMARRGLLLGEGLGEKLFWVEKALLFDVRRGAHSVGSGVRDAACYVLWALARAHDAQSIRPYADSLSRALVCVALLDRDISIRRAASAAFQECVGRLGIFAHGIDVIRKTDFYAVSVRRNAFTHCLPQVAEHPEYRQAIITHLIDVTLLHWDVGMRELGAEALALVVAMDIERFGIPIIQSLSKKCLGSKDNFTLHGCLLALAEIGAACSSSAEPKAKACRTLAYETLGGVKVPMSRIPGTQHVLRAACRLITSCFIEQSATTYDASKQSGTTNVWSTYVDLSIERQEPECHDAAAEAIATVSRLQDLTPRIKHTLATWRRNNVAQGQANAVVLGAYAYCRYSKGLLEQVVRFFISLVSVQSSTRSPNIETRRNAYLGIAKALVGLKDDVSGRVTPALMNDVWRATLEGLEDYSTDARGDVGSWVRMACMDVLRRLMDLFIAHFPFSKESIDAYVPQKVVNETCVGLARQMLDRIDSVRTQAKSDFLHVVRMFTHANTNLKLLDEDAERISQVFPPSQDEQLKDLSVLYEKSVALLALDTFRSEIFKGVILAIGSQRETMNRTLAEQLTRFVLAKDSSYTLLQFVRQLTDFAFENVRSNRFFIPCLQTLNFLLEDDVIQTLTDDEGHRKEAQEVLQRTMNMAVRSIDKVKSVPRILAAAQYTTNLLRLSALQARALHRMSDFLLHPFPMIRASSAELLYIQAQTFLDTISDEAEDILLSTAWSEDQPDTLRPCVQQLISSLGPPTQNE